MPKNGGRKGTVETEKNRRGMLPEKSRSFHGKGTMPLPNPGELRRPKTLPELFSNGQSVGLVASPTALAPRLTKLLLNVTVQGSLGALQIIIAPEATVSDLIAVAIRQYVKEVRRPFLTDSEPCRFDLHYSQFSLESKIPRSLKSLESNYLMMQGMDPEFRIAYRYWQRREADLAWFKKLFPLQSERRRRHRRWINGVLFEGSRESS